MHTKQAPKARDASAFDAKPPNIMGSLGTSDFRVFGIKINEGRFWLYDTLLLSY